MNDRSSENSVQHHLSFLLFSSPQLNCKPTPPPMSQPAFSLTLDYPAGAISPVRCAPSFPHNRGICRPFPSRRLEIRDAEAIMQAYGRAVVEHLVSTAFRMHFSP